MQPFPFSLLMVRPVHFGYNAETAVNNAFQEKDANQALVSEAAVKEFDHFVAVLRQHDIDVLVVQDSEEPHTPDSIFPNNWVSTHEDGSLVYYPMYAPNRRLERKDAVINALNNTYQTSTITDLSHYEAQDLFLEGTGSIILDRKKRIAYACISPRTDKKLFGEFCQLKGYTPISFTALDMQEQPIYHTNVMMCLGDNYAVICLDSIKDATEKAFVSDALKRSNKTIVDISLEQMNQFAGNMFQVKSRDGLRYLVMSEQAYKSLTPAQVSILETFNPILHVPLYTIEKNGGGSARCMMAEIVLKKK